MLVFPAKSADALCALNFCDIHIDSLSVDFPSGRFPLLLGNLQQVFVSHSLHEGISKERQRQAERTDIFRRTQLTNRVCADRSLIDKRAWPNFASIVQGNRCPHKVSLTVKMTGPQLVDLTVSAVSY